MKEDHGQRLLTIHEVADILRISHRTIYNQINRKAVRKFPIRVIRVGRLIRFDRHAVNEFIKN